MDSGREVRECDADFRLSCLRIEEDEDSTSFFSLGVFESSG